MIIRRNSVTFSPEEWRRLMAITEFGGLSDEMHQLFYNERGVAVTFAEFGEVLWWTYRLLQSEWRYNRHVYGVRNPRGLYTGDVVGTRRYRDCLTLVDIFRRALSRAARRIPRQLMAGCPTPRRHHFKDYPAYAKMHCAHFAYFCHDRMTLWGDNEQVHTNLRTERVVLDRMFGPAKVQL